MDCKEFKKHLYEYLDQEMEPDQLAEMTNHVNECPLCQLELEKEKKFDAFVRTYAVAEEMPYELRESIINQINAQHPIKQYLQKLKLFWKPGLAAMGMVMIMTMLIVVKNLAHKPFPVFAASTENHIDFLKGSYPVEIETQDMDEALSWFDGKLDFAVQRPHVNTDKARLIGARLVHVQNRKAAYFIFEKDGRYISAFVMHLENETLPPVDKQDIQDYGQMVVYRQNRQGYNNYLCYHKDVGTGCLIVSDLSSQELKDIMG